MVVANGLGTALIDFWVGLKDTEADLLSCWKKISDTASVQVSDSERQRRKVMLQGSEAPPPPRKKRKKKKNMQFGAF